jgi:hypothetical protein
MFEPRIWSGEVGGVALEHSFVLAIVDTRGHVEEFSRALRAMLDASAELYARAGIGLGS